MEPIEALQILYNTSRMAHQPEPVHAQCRESALALEVFIKHYIASKDIVADTNTKITPEP